MRDKVPCDTITIEQKFYTITYFVYESLTGEPIADATCMYDGYIVGYTDLEGYYVYDDAVSEGEHDFSAMKSGYDPSTKTRNITSDEQINIPLTPT